MVSIERVIGYGKLQSEGGLETGKKYKIHIHGWPKKGAIKLHRMKFRYAEGYPYVLKSMSLQIDSREKVCHRKPCNIIMNGVNRLALWVGLELASLLCCQHCSD